MSEVQIACAGRLDIFFIKGFCRRGASFGAIFFCFAGLASDIREGLRLLILRK